MRLSLPGQDDRNVLAAAIRGGAEAITANAKDFRTTALAPFGLEAVHPDDSLLDQRQPFSTIGEDMAAPAGADAAAGVVPETARRPLRELMNGPLLDALLEWSRALPGRPAADRGGLDARRAGPGGPGAGRVNIASQHGRDIDARRPPRWSGTL